MGGAFQLPGKGVLMVLKITRRLSSASRSGTPNTGGTAITMLRVLLVLSQSDCPLALGPSRGSEFRKAWRIRGGPCTVRGRPAGATSLVHGERAGKGRVDALKPGRFQGAHTPLAGSGGMHCGFPFVRSSV